MTDRTTRTTVPTRSRRPHDLDGPATVERLIARPLPDLLMMLRQVENLTTWYDGWDTVTPTTGTLDQPGTTFTLARSGLPRLWLTVNLRAPRDRRLGTP